jgi:hypothetical protein
MKKNEKAKQINDAWILCGKWNTSQLKQSPKIK